MQPADKQAIQIESERLIAQALEHGKAAALEALLKMHADYIYNICRGMFLNPIDAEDASQEILIKLTANLAKYDARRGRFRTWIYRIAANHAIDMRRTSMEELVSDFAAYGRDLDSVPFEEIGAGELSNPETQLLIEEAKLGCMLGMLLCLDRKQRMTFLLGEVMRLDSQEAAAILGISSDAYRQRLSRARSDLYQFMQNQCGLINKANPCRCHRKTKGFIKAGYVDPANIKFAGPHLQRIRAMAENGECTLDEYNNAGYAELYRENPFYETPATVVQKLMAQLEVEFIKRGS
ncbi:MAG: RNA polymerase sigma factor [Leptospirales bacterium]|nr:RNA polymerase sigma factor [Leptospirales bacterium]